MRAVLLLTLALAGCLGGAGDDVTDTDPHVDPPFVPTYGANVTEAVDWWESFVENSPRHAYVPDSPATFNQASRDVIAATLRDAGFEVNIRSYAPGVLGVSGPDQPAVNAWAVEATWPGLDAGNESLGRVGMIAHYDTLATTIQGAYDNGSGTAAVVHTCIELSKAELRRTLTCVLFDAEEVGTVASGRYVDDIADEQPFDVVLGFDMVGINCPGHEWKQYQFLASNFADLLFPLVNRTMRTTLGVDEACTEIFTFNDRNSDESQFASANIPTIRFAGGRTAGSYPEYHTTDDTVDFVYEYVGGRANWEAGFDAIMHAAWAIVVAFDPVEPLA